MNIQKTIDIRHAEPEDYKEIHAIFSQPAAISGTLQLPYTSAEVWKDRLLLEPDRGFSLVARVDGKIVGNCVLLLEQHSARRRHCASLGMGVHDERQGQGVGTALLQATLDKADNWLNLLRVELTVFADNEAAIRLYEKNGFRIEGKHEKYAFRNGEFVDSLAMARLKDNLF